ncbi:MAG: TIGR00701 family protein [Rhodospirillales bacterium RIFCSPLOWO2_12_FULL_58_28]|nr:MAG: TIGR00701 family protein [Rhodospirillales bacterium RIFCSPLOWO2_02_FULL_58_16]OHC79855.1 MAG: TIGR00701 family protein [Rhodospirillales bacterium RIFCSPLOWO2_12_FULL_58_28]
MFELSGTAYLWIKALHIISVIAWMAGLLYLPRLFVYHTQVEPDSPSSALFKVMERRLLKAIMHPAMASSVLFGGLLSADLAAAAWAMGWLHAKLLCVAGLLATHAYLARCVADFAADNNKCSEKFYRFINEVPTALMIGIVILAVVKP